MQKYKRELSLGFFTRSSFKDFETVDLVMNLWHEHFKETFPDRWGPLRANRNFSIEYLEDLRSDWEFMAFFTRRKEQSLEFTISIDEPMEVSGRYSVLKGHPYYTDAMERSADAFISAVCSNLTIALGYLHLTNETDWTKEINSGHQHLTKKGVCGKYLYERASKYSSLSYFLPKFELGVPNLYWKTYLGRECIDILGEDQISSCPAYKVEWLNREHAAIQLTDSICDSFLNEDSFENTRLMAKKHFGIEKFQVK